MIIQRFGMVEIRTAWPTAPILSRSWAKMKYKTRHQEQEGPEKYPRAEYSTERGAGERNSSMVVTVKIFNLRIDHWRGRTAGTSTSQVNQSRRTQRAKYPRGLTSRTAHWI